MKFWLYDEICVGIPRVSGPFRANQMIAMPTLPPLTYALHPDEKISHGFFRVLGELCARAEELPGSSQPMPELTHEGRVLIKRMRALLWFAHPALDDAAYAQAKADLRRASNILAGQRDLKVTQTTLEKIAKKTTRGKILAAVRASLESLAQENAKDEIDAQRAKLARAVAIIGRLSTLIKRSTAKTAKWPSPSKRLKKAFRLVHQAEKKAESSGEDTAFHAWRKKAKRLFFELQLTETESASPKRRILKDADELQNTLGNHQDCVVVVSKLSGLKIPDPAKGRVARLLKTRKKKLRKKSRRLARLLVAEI
jgi:CHAD domain-containing protein